MLILSLKYAYRKLTINGGNTTKDLEGSIVGSETKENGDPKVDTSGYRKQ